MRPITSSRIVSDICKALSVEARVRIVELLKTGPLCVGALAKELAMTPAGVSQHLRVLKAAGLVVAAKRGYFVHYSLDRDTLRRYAAAAALFFDTGA